MRADVDRRFFHPKFWLFLLILLTIGQPDVLSAWWSNQRHPVWASLSSGAFQYRTSAVIREENFQLEERFCDTVPAPALNISVGFQVHSHLMLSGLLGFSAYETGDSYRYDNYELPNGSFIDAKASYRLNVAAYPMLLTAEWLPLGSPRLSPSLTLAIGATWLRVTATGTAKAVLDDDYTVRAYGREFQSWFIPSARLGIGAHTRIYRNLFTVFDCGYQWCYGAHDDELTVTIVDQVRIPARTRLAVERGGWYAAVGFGCLLGRR